MLRTAITSCPANGGIQHVYRFPNGYGASVVQHSFSYGGKDGLWELAVVRFTGDGDREFSLCYDTHITSDVLGWLSDEDVNKTLDDIEALPSAATVVVPPDERQGVIDHFNSVVQDDVKAKALAKLTDEELAALGLTRE